MQLRRLGLIAGCALTLVACGDELDDSSAFDLEEVDTLAQTKSDGEYMRKLVDANPKSFIVIDFGDDIQHRFVLNRLKATGKTRATAPELFTRIDEARAKALQARASGDASRATVAAPDGYSHLIAHVVADRSDTSKLTTDAYLTNRGGAPYSYLDVVMLDARGNTIGETVQEEQYYEGTEVLAGTIGRLKSTTSTSDRCITVDSLGISDANGFFSTFSAVSGCLNTPGTMFEPRDQQLPGVPKDGIITVCLNRSWLYDAYDCEYKMDNTGGKILFPLKGEMDFGNRVIRIRKALAELSLPTNGGSCAPKLDFLSQLKLDGTRVKWDIPAADFGGKCFAHQQHVNININIQVDVDINGTEFPGMGTISSQATDLTAKIEEIRFASSCLAAGTLVRTAGGDLRAIETIGQDDQILANRDGVALSVTDLSIGIEDAPMVSLEDDWGHHLLLTEGHPVITPAGVVRADELKVGDFVLSENGISVLTKVDRELYDGKVYNLKLGTNAERRLIEKDDTTMFANGILVGDGRIQAEIEFDGPRGHQKVKPGQKWYRDYVNSQARGR